jgi:hypothetical protein
LRSREQEPGERRPPAHAMCPMPTLTPATTPRIGPFAVSILRSRPFRSQFKRSSWRDPQDRREPSGLVLSTHGLASRMTRLWPKCRATCTSRRRACVPVAEHPARRRESGAPGHRIEHVHVAYCSIADMMSRRGRNVKQNLRAGAASSSKTNRGIDTPKRLVIMAHVAEFPECAAST